MRPFFGTVLVLCASACACSPSGGAGAASASASPNDPSSVSERRPEAQSAPKKGPATVVETDEISIPLPDGYHDVTAEMHAAHIVLTLIKNEPGGYSPSITIMKAPIPGGSFADPEECSRTGHGLVTGGTEGPGPDGVLKSAQIIDGPAGKTCQIHLVASQGVAIITELHRAPNTPLTPKDILLMVCNHAEGDDAAEATCRATLAGFRFRTP